MKFIQWIWQCIADTVILKSSKVNEVFCVILKKPMTDFNSAVGSIQSWWATFFDLVKQFSEQSVTTIQYCANYSV